MNNQDEKFKDLQKNFDRTVNAFVEKANINKIGFTDWATMYSLYQTGMKAGLSMQSLTRLIGSLANAQVIDIITTDQDKLYSQVMKRIKQDIAMQKLNNDYDENGMLRPAAAWTDSQKREMMGFNDALYHIEKDTKKSK